MLQRYDCPRSREARRWQRDRQRIDDLDPAARRGERLLGLSLLAFGQPPGGGARFFGAALHCPHHDARHVAARRIFPAPRIAAVLSLGGGLRLALGLIDALFGGGEIGLDGRLFDRLARAIGAPAAAIAGGTGGGQFDDRVHLLEQFAIVTDDDRAALPVVQDRAYRLTALPVEIVGRFVEQQKIGPCEHRAGERGARALPTRKMHKRRCGIERQVNAGQRLVDPRRQRPVGLRDIVERRRPRFGAREQGQRRARAEQIGNRRIGGNLHRLVQHGDVRAAADRAVRRRCLTRDQAQQGRFADAVAADDTRAFGAKLKVEIGKYAATVGGRPAEAGEGDRRHGQGFPEGKARGDAFSCGP